MENPHHVPVLSKQVLDLLKVRAGGTYADATLGLAGHSSQIARALGPQGTLIALDRDPDAMRIATERLGQLRQELGAAMPNVVLVPEAFSSIRKHVEPGTLDGLLADFGVSSLQLDQAERGFSFRQDAPLDMRMDTRSGVTAEQVVNQADENDLANLIYEFGEERRSRRIARAIVRARPILTTAELAKVISTAAPAMKGDKIHPATLTFQALRIHVNQELSEIRMLLQSAPSLLRSGGRLVVISFHSLEDRLAKDALRDAAGRGTMNVLTRKPLIADEDELRANARSRSAKLRAAERIEAVAKPVKAVAEGGSRRGRR